MQIQVKTPDGQVVAIDAEDSMTCGELKAALAKKTCVAPEAQKLTVGGKIMKEDKTVGDFPAAATQVVSLVISCPGTGHPQSPARSKASREQLEAFFDWAVEWFKSTEPVACLAKRHPATTRPTDGLAKALGIAADQSVTQLLLTEGVKIFNGDWTPFDAYHATVTKYVLQALGGPESANDCKRAEWVDSAVRAMVHMIEEVPRLKEQLAEHSKVGRDVVQEATPAVKACLSRAIDLLLDGASTAYPSHPLFSDQVRLLVVTAAGAVVDTVIDVLDDGKPMCQQLMVEYCGLAIQRLSDKMLELSTLFASAGPVIVEQLTIWHEEYATTIKNKTFTPPPAH
ncbi:hypothetical protein DIPPA_12465 [Diplonema papillatum]|nr:hypothetical protein DIPPA_12465 [Diplonema papillatum]|eukprot:gene2816-4406_t